MTPNDIEILIHCHVSPTPHPRRDAGAVDGALKSFVCQGLIEQRGSDIYYTTDKGAAHVAQLCSVPIPIKQFIGYDGKVIKV